MTAKVISGPRGHSDMLIPTQTSGRKPPLFVHGLHGVTTPGRVFAQSLLRFMHEDPTIFEFPGERQAEPTAG